MLFSFSKATSIEGDENWIQTNFTQVKLILWSELLGKYKKSLLSFC